MNVHFSIKKVFAIVLGLSLGVLIFFSVFIYGVSGIQRDKKVFTSFEIMSDDEMNKVVETLKHLGYRNHKIELLKEATTCEGYEKVRADNGNKEVVFKNKNGACIMLTLEPTPLKDAFVERIWLPFIVIFALLFSITYNNRFLFYKIDKGFLSGEELMENITVLTLRIMKKDTNVLSEQLNYMDKKELETVKDNLYLTSAMLIKDSKEFYKVNEEYTRIIEYFNAKHLFFLSDEFYIDRSKLEGLFMLEIKRHSRFIKNKFFYIISLYNTSAFQLLIFVTLYVVFNGMLLSVLYSGGGIETHSFLFYCYQVLSLSDNLGGDIDMTISPLIMWFGIYLQITGIALFGIMVTVMGRIGSSRS